VPEPHAVALVGHRRVELAEVPVALETVLIGGLHLAVVRDASASSQGLAS
jgi:hypothetical protein